MLTREFKLIEKLANQAILASKTAVKNRFTIETLLSVQEMKTGKATKHKSVNDLFNKLKLN